MCFCYNLTTFHATPLFMSDTIRGQSVKDRHNSLVLEFWFCNKLSCRHNLKYFHINFHNHDKTVTTVYEYKVDVVFRASNSFILSYF